MMRRVTYEPEEAVVEVGILGIQFNIQLENLDCFFMSSIDMRS